MKINKYHIELLCASIITLFWYAMFCIWFLHPILQAFAVPLMFAMAFVLISRNHED